MHSEIRERWRAAGQEQVFRFWSALDTSARDRLAEQARRVDPDRVNAVFASTRGPAAVASDLTPLDARDASDPRDGEAREAGRRLLAEGAVAFCTVAGGQATRLDFPQPKGCFPVGPASRKTLFEWHAEKVRAVSRRFGVEVPWALMVSDATAEATERWFADRDWLGLRPRPVLFRQPMMPAVDASGRILLAAPDRIALSPDGHGGFLQALHESGLARDLAARGIRAISYFQVDNALVNPADPALLGHHVLAEAEMTSKVVEKDHALEKAGVVALVGGRPGVVEYSELPEDLARETEPDGRLRFRLASIAAHVFSLDFLGRLRDVELPWHVAVKQVRALDDAGRRRRRSARKFERFIFDTIPLARSFVAYLVDRAEDFAPLKNAEGENSPETVRRALLERGRRWRAAAGLPPAEREEDLEVSPLRAYDLETFREWAKGR